MLTKDWHPADHLSFASNHPGHKPFEQITLKETGVDQVLWPDHCVQHSTGSDFHPDLVTKDTDELILKG